MELLIHHKKVKGRKDYKRWLFLKYRPFKTIPIWPCKQVKGGTLGLDVIYPKKRLPEWLPEFVFNIQDYLRLKFYRMRSQTK